MASVAYDCVSVPLLLIYYLFVTRQDPGEPDIHSFFNFFPFHFISYSGDIQSKVLKIEVFVSFANIRQFQLSSIV